MNKHHSLTNGLAQELHEYIEAFRTSSDRARYALYVVIVATALLGIANWNLRDGSWPLSRLEHWYQYAVEPPGSAPITADASEPRPATSEIPADLFSGDPEQLKIARDEYLRQVVSRAFLTPSPIPGVWIDFNDLGLIGGIALCLLLLVLVLSIVREHENLYLALFRVRSLCEDDPHHHEGHSYANFLYHGLAMRQVLSSPPTLARWRKNRAFQLADLVFFTPGAIYGWIVITNWQTMERGARYGVSVDPLLFIQILLGMLIFILGFFALLYSRSMAKRWKRAFERINPGRLHAPQMRLREWIDFRLTCRQPSRAHARLMSVLIDTMKGSDACVPLSPDELMVKLKLSHTSSSSRLSPRDRDKMAALIVTDGEKLAKAECRARAVRFVTLETFTPVANEVVVSGGKAKWLVEGAWTCRVETSKP